MTQPLLVALHKVDASATFLVTSTQGKEVAIQVALLETEYEAIRTIADDRPFGAEKHNVFLQGFRLGDEAACQLRSALQGSRKDWWIAISAATLDGLQYVWNRFAADPELVPQRPSSVLHEAPNPSIERTSPC
jgi:hypothetical protein